MGLISGMVFGMVAGIALMAGWKQMMRYRSTKRVSKAVDIKLLGSLGRDELKKICGDNFPQWISFPAFDQVKWLNKQISKMWPFVAEVSCDSPFCIRMQSLKEGQITMDVDFRWGGDPSIILAVDALVASLPIQLKDLQVFTVARVIFQLSEEIPCISAVVAALLAEPKPRIEYTLKAVGGSLTAVPGLSDMIDDIVHNIVDDMLQWPHRIVVPLGGVDVDISELELRPQGKLQITVAKATDLKNMEMIGKSDPYVVLYIRPLFKSKTKVIENNLNPVWDETFELIVEDKETQTVIFEVFDEDVGQDKRLGVVKLPLNELVAEKAIDRELRLLPALDMLKIKDKKDRGTLTIKVLYHQFDKDEQLAAMEAEKKMLEERQRLKEAGIIGSTMDAVGGAASLVGSGVGFVGTGLVAGVGLVGSGIGAGAGLVGSGIGAGAGLVGSGIGAVGSGLGKAGKFMTKGVSNLGGSSKKANNSTAAAQANGAAS
ncbi:Synaptotagmin-4 [Nymphaea thermarum]|nr:Synaptotagmin-4 [Nymphaea thermarum]